MSKLTFPVVICDESVGYVSELVSDEKAFNQAVLDAVESGSNVKDLTILEPSNFKVKLEATVA